MLACVLQVNASLGGVPKKPIPEGQITFTSVEQDDGNEEMHYGGPDPAVSLFSVGPIDELKAKLIKPFHEIT